MGRRFVPRCRDTSLGLTACILPTSSNKFFRVLERLNVSGVAQSISIRQFFREIRVAGKMLSNDA